MYMHIHLYCTFACICTWTIQIVCVKMTPTNDLQCDVTNKIGYMMYVRVLTFGFFSITISDSRSNSGSMKSRSPVPSHWTTRGC